MIHGICNSHDVSQFAALFIDQGTKVSVVKSCLGYCCCLKHQSDDLGRILPILDSLVLIN